MRSLTTMLRPCRHKALRLAYPSASRFAEPPTFSTLGTARSARCSVESHTLLFLPRVRALHILAAWHGLPLAVLYNVFPSGSLGQWQQPSRRVGARRLDDIPADVRASCRKLIKRRPFATSAAISCRRAAVRFVFGTVRPEPTRLSTRSDRHSVYCMHAYVPHAKKSETTPQECANTTAGMGSLDTPVS